MSQAPHVRAPLGLLDFRFQSRRAEGGDLRVLGLKFLTWGSGLEVKFRSGLSALILLVGGGGLCPTLCELRRVTAVLQRRRGHHWVEARGIYELSGNASARGG